MNNNSVQLILDWVPGLALVSAALCMLLLLIGWICSVEAGYRSEAARRMRLFLVFPLTNPFALLVFLWRDWRAARFSLFCHVAALAVLWGGGMASQWNESRKMANHMERIQKAGESLSVESLIPKSVPDTSNIWMHPFLEPLALAGQNTPEGNTARQAKSYTGLELPPQDSKIDYPSAKNRRRDSDAYSGKLQNLHEAALNALAARDGEINGRNTPSSWRACGQAVVDHFAPAEQSFKDLSQALERPFDQYPYDWHGGFAMLLPQLARLKSFTQTAALLTTAEAAFGRPAESFENAQLGLSLVQTGDSDLAISRLLQMAQLTIMLRAVRDAQQFHVWSEEQWRAIEAHLGGLDFPSLIPAALRAERIFGHETIAPMTRMSPSRIILHIDQLGVAEAGTTFNAPANPFRIPLDLLLSGHGRATLTRHWLMALQAYEEMISGIEQTLQKTRSSPWKDCDVPELARGYKGYGILAGMLLPALDKLFQKAINAQAHIELAKVACALERYYLRNKAYPESLAALVPDYLSGPLRDPMDHQPWRYARDGQNGFRLYGVGENGVDDGGDHEVSGSTDRKDDIPWMILPNPPPLPAFVYRSSETSSSDDNIFRMDPEMLRRYGLMPSDPQKP